MLDALTNLKMEFVEEKKDLRRIEQSTVCEDTCNESKRLSTKNAIAFMLVLFVLVCVWMAWYGYEMRQIQKHLKILHEQANTPSNFDRFYADYRKAGGSKALKQVDK